jgi:hypothetical protein
VALVVMVQHQQLLMHQSLMQVAAAEELILEQRVLVDQVAVVQVDNHQLLVQTEHLALVVEAVVHLQAQVLALAAVASSFSNIQKQLHQLQTHQTLGSLELLASGLHQLGRQILIT